MTPERLRELQALIRNARVDWERREIVFLPSPSEAQAMERTVTPEPGTNVVRLRLKPRAVAFRLGGGTLARFDKTTGDRIGPPAPVKWIEAEGYVIFAWSSDLAGFLLAEEIVGQPVPRARRA